MKKFIAVILLFSSLQVNSAELISLDSYIAESPNWSKDTSALAYFATRCDCLFTVVGTYFVENGKDDASKSAGKKLMLSGTSFNDVAVKLSFIVNMNEKSIADRYKMVIDSYADRLIQNKQLNNNMFDSFMQSDVTICSKYSKLFEELAKKLK